MLLSLVDKSITWVGVAFQRGQRINVSLRSLVQSNFRNRLLPGFLDLVVMREQGWRRGPV